MKREYLFILFLFVLINANSQSTNTTDQATSVPSYAPVAPEAANLGKYGDTPINLATGKLNLSIPLYTIKMNGYELPVFLSYAYDGFIPEQDPALVGLGWNLVAGGMVTRKKLGLHDNQSEHSTSSVYNTVEKYYYNTATDNEILSLIDRYINSTEDTQPDRFSVNLGSLNANFSYDTDGNPVFYPNKNYLVNQTSGVDANFEIIDDKGIKYIFADTETTTIDPGQSLTQVPEDYISTWKISTIILPNSKDSINFSYYTSFPNCSDCLTYEKAFESLTKNKVIKKSGNEECLEKILPTTNFSYSQSFSTTEQITIKRIDFPDGYIEFDVQPITTIGTKAKNKQYLNAVNIYDKYDNLLTKYEFVYEDETHKNNYNLLKQIKKTGYINNPAGKEEPFYRFEYYGMPSLWAVDQKYAVDLWGYYNGQISNSQTFSDNMDVDFNSTRLGALKKIYYPTGGYNLLEYEQNSIDKGDASLMEGGICSANIFNLHKTLTVYGRNLSPQDSHREDNIYIGTTQIVKISLSAGATPGVPNSANASIEFVGGAYQCDPQNTYCNDGCLTSVTAQGDEMPTEQNIQDYVDYYTGNSTTNGNITGNTRNTVSYFKVFAGTTIKMICDAGADSNFSAANIQIDYWDGVEKELKVGGIRINKVKVYDDENNISYQNRYIYKNEDELTSSGKILSYPRFKWQTHYVGKLYDNTPMSSRIFFCSADIQYQAKNSKIPLAGFDGSPVVYQRIEKLTTDENDNEKDKVVSYFTAFDNPVVDVPFLPVNRKNWKQAKLTKKILYKKENNVFEKIAEQTNQYDEITPFSIDDKHSIGFGAMKMIFYIVINGSTSGNWDMLSYYNKDTYIDYPQYYWINNSTEFKFFDNGTVSNTITYDYDLETGYIKKNTATDSRGDVVSTHYFYPYEVTSSSSLGNINLTSEQLSAYNMLTNNNMIQTPVQKVTEINNQEVQRQRTTYRSILQNYNLNLVVPESEFFGKNAMDMEERIVFHNYDLYGNPVKISKKDGTKILYIWGYHHQKVIAKIINPDPDPGVSSTLVDIAIDLSNKDEDNMLNNPNGTEQALWQSLENIRNSLPEESQMTYYTYDPMVGLTSITQPNGDIQYYRYDEMGRLQKILDKNKNILKEYEYHYKPFPVEFDDMYIEMIAHDEVNSTVTFQVVNPNGISADYQWELPPDVSIISGQGTPTIEVAYQCRPNLLFGVDCLVSDITYPNVNTGLHLNFYWDGCLSDGDLNVTLNTSTVTGGNSGTGNDNTGDDTTSITTDSIQLSVSNLSGGQGNLSYRWYYIINGIEILFDTTSVPQTEISANQNAGTFDEITGNFVRFKCVVVDNTTQQEFEIYENNGYGHYIFPAN